MKKIIVNEFPHQTIYPTPVKNFLDNIVIKNANEDLETVVHDFVNNQNYASINGNGKLERNIFLNEFKKWLYENCLNCIWTNDLIISQAKTEYFKKFGKNSKNEKDFWEKIKVTKTTYWNRKGE